MAIDESSPAVQQAMAKAEQLMPMVKEWDARMAALQADPRTTDDERREMARMGIELVATGLDLAVPYMYDEDFPEPCRKAVEKMMSDIPIFREVNGIL